MEGENSGQKKKHRVLCFSHAGKNYRVSLEPDTLGHVMGYSGNDRQLDFPLPHPSWVVTGVSFHHWTRHIDLKIAPDVNPEKLLGGLVWDVDNGTTRMWGGAHNGKVPRIESAWIVEEEPAKSNENAAPAPGR